MIGSFQGFDPYSYFRVPEMFFHFPFSNGFLTCRPWVWVRKQQEKEDWCHPNQTSNPKTTGIYFQPQNGGWKFGVSGLNISNPKFAHMAKFGRVVVRFGEQSFPNLAEVSHLVMDKSVWIIQQPRFFFLFPEDKLCWHDATEIWMSASFTANFQEAVPVTCHSWLSVCFLVKNLQWQLWRSQPPGKTEALEILRRVGDCFFDMPATFRVHER